MEPRIQVKLWNPALEKIVLQKWNNNKLFKFSVDKSKNAFVIDTPPPYPSGRPWHIGAAAHYAQIDMIARTARMMGHNVLFPIGIDRNGLPVEAYTEKKYKIVMRKTDREKFLELCAHALDDLEDEMIQIMRSLGISGNFEEYYRTDSEEFRALTQATFINLWEQNLIYRANRPNNFCPDCGTSIADAEIIYENIPTKLAYIRFRIRETGKSIVVASTRPELLFACQILIINPKDERYGNLLGKHAVVPIFKREVKIIAHPSAKPDFGSGIVMVCSYGDENDVRLFRELGLKEIVSLNENGKTTSEAGPYANMSVVQARSKITEDLKNMGILEKEEHVTHRTPTCERSKTPLEIISLEEYYLKQLDYIPALRELAKKIIFHPASHRQILLNWIDSIAIDWPITRRRFYGTEVPIWYCDKCKCPNLPGGGKYYRPWKEKPPFKNCSKCGGTEFVGESRIFDTWMDSSITPLFITKYEKESEFYDHTYPTTIRPQGKDIIRTWFYYTLLRCFQLTKRSPWSDAWIMGYGLDEKGEKMSKSKGNVIDPAPIILRYGADVFRYWSAAESNLGQDFRCSEGRIATAKNFLSKLWNIGRFLSSFDVISEEQVIVAGSDKWIIGELSNLIDQCREGYANFNFFASANAIREFAWNVFAAHYIEMVKGRIYDTSDQDARRSAIFTSHKCFSTILLLLAPICPFITEELWTNIYSDESIHLQSIPQPSPRYYEMTKYTRLILDFNSFVWNKKKETISEETGKPLSLKDSIGSVSIPSELALFKEDLIRMHNLNR